MTSPNGFAPNDLTLESVAKELRYFADRSIYDAIATIYTRNKVQSKRVHREYTLDSVEKHADLSDYPYAPDRHLVPGVSEVAVGAMWHLTKNDWTMIYSGIRSSYLFVDSENRVKVYADFNSNEASNVVTVAAMGEMADVNRLLDIMSEAFTPVLERSAIRFQLDAQGGIASEKITCPEPPPYVEGLYPNVGEDPKQLWEHFADSKSRVMIFWGIPGGGKSSFSTQMIQHRGYHKLAMVDDAEVLQHPNLISAIRQLPDGALVLFEDSDILLQKRTEGNRQMSALLNVISGVAERDIRFVFNTNLDTLNKIDEALLRKGRCYRDIKFEVFSADQVNLIREKLGKVELPEEIVYAKKAWTLADIIHEGDSYGAKQHKVGFN